MQTESEVLVRYRTHTHMHEYSIEDSQTSRNTEEVYSAGFIGKLTLISRIDNINEIESLPFVG